PTPACHTRSLHDALPICGSPARAAEPRGRARIASALSSLPSRSFAVEPDLPAVRGRRQVIASILLSLLRVQDLLQLSIDTVENRSEEHTSELQSRSDLVC